MEYRQLKNYGKVFVPRPSPRVMVASITSIPTQLGFIGTPKFVATLQSKQRFRKNRRFETAEGRGITHEEFMDGMRNAIAFYDALIATCGEEKAVDVYWRLTERIGVMIYEEFMPSSEDFLRCSDPWEAFRQYFHEWFRAYAREGALRYEVVEDSASEFLVHVTDCAWEFMSREAGYPEMASMNAQCDVLFLPQLMRGLGGYFKRDYWLCKGDALCDWHFFRGKG